MQFYVTEGKKEDCKEIFNSVVLNMLISVTKIYDEMQNKIHFEEKTAGEKQKNKKKRRNDAERKVDGDIRMLMYR